MFSLIWIYDILAWMYSILTNQGPQISAQYKKPLLIEMKQRGIWWPKMSIVQQYNPSNKSTSIKTTRQLRQHKQI